MAQIYLPGDVIPLAGSNGKKTQVIGRGLEKAGKVDELIVVQPGVCRVEDGRQWMSVHSRRYIPECGDRVLGVVISSHGDVFKIDIGSTDIALINFMSFEGATKRNRPNLKTGDLIYATVMIPSKHLEPELTCVDCEGRARGLGQLPSEGFMFRTSLNLIRRLLSPNSSLLMSIGKDLKFEVTCGVNGRVWLNSDSLAETMAVYRMIKESELISELDIKGFVEDHIRELRGFSVDDEHSLH